jgi:hypothetical protein
MTTETTHAYPETATFDTAKARKLILERRLTNAEIAHRLGVGPKRIGKLAQSMGVSPITQALQHRDPRRYAAILASVNGNEGTYAEIGKKHGVSHNTVRAIARRHNIDARTRRIVTPQVVERFIALAKAGKSARQIAQMTGFAATTISSHIRGVAGVPSTKVAPRHAADNRDGGEAFVSRLRKIGFDPGDEALIASMTRLRAFVSENGRSIIPGAHEREMAVA